MVTTGTTCLRQGRKTQKITKQDYFTFFTLSFAPGKEAIYSLVSK
jgi:hypothetical protein